MELNNISKYKTLSSNKLLLKLEEIDKKIDIARNCQNADIMLQSLLEYRTNIEQEIALRIASGKINDVTYFEVDDFLRKQEELRIAFEEAKQEANNKWITEEINDIELQEELKNLKINYERELNELDKTL